MKKAFLPALAACTLLVLTIGMGGKPDTPSAAETAKPAGTMAVLNMQTIYEQSKVGQAGIAHLQGFQELALNKYNEVRQNLQQAQEEEDEAKLQRLQIEVQAMTYSMQEAMNQEQERIIALIADNVGKGIEQYRAAQGLSIIMASDSLQAFDPALDVTSDIIKTIDALPFSLGEYPPLTQPGMTITPEPVETPDTPEAE